MDEYAVVIVGAGPTGLMLAAELALAGVDVAVVERRVDQHVEGARARGLHARTLEVLDQRGVVDRFVAAGTTHPSVGYAGTTLDISDFPTRHNYVLALEQRDFEPILAAWVDELGVPILRGCDVVDFTQSETGVTVEISAGTSLRTNYLVGCDGGRSRVRSVAGIDFPGLEPSTSWIIAEVEMDEQPDLGFRTDESGTHVIGPTSESGLYGVVIMEPYAAQAAQPSMVELRAAVVSVYGTDFGMRTASWISRFTDAARQAASYRNGQILLAGDAAHIHPPQGGQGLGIGVQDAVNLGWKLAQVVAGNSSDTLLDTYHAERHPVGARVLHNSMAQVALGRPDERSQAARDTVHELLTTDEPRQRIVGMLSGLDIDYDLAGDHPLVGRRVPDVDIETSDGPTRVYELLHAARPILLNLGEPGRFDLGEWTGRVRMVEAHSDTPWELPVLGAVAAPDAVLIRPDGHAAWVGTANDPGLDDALTTWFGAPAPTSA